MTNIEGADEIPIEAQEARGYLVANAIIQAVGEIDCCEPYHLVGWEDPWLQAVYWDLRSGGQLHGGMRLVVDASKPVVQIGLHPRLHGKLAQQYVAQPSSITKREVRSWATVAGSLSKLMMQRYTDDFKLVLEEIADLVRATCQGLLELVVEHELEEFEREREATAPQSQRSLSLVGT